MREKIICLSAKRAARPIGQHNERDRSAARQSIADALRWFGQQLVRAEFPRGSAIRKARSDAKYGGEVRMHVLELYSTV